jgi:hypothetical protein
MKKQCLNQLFYYNFKDGLHNFRLILEEICYGRYGDEIVSRDSSVGIANRLRAGQSRYQG